MAADRVAHDLDERLEVVVEELRVEAGRGVGVPHQRAGRRRVEAALLALLELRRAEGEEVGALAAPHVDHLDVLAGLHLVGERRGAVDLEVEPRVGERIGEDGLAVAARRASRARSRAGGRRRARRPRRRRRRRARRRGRRASRSARNVSSAPGGDVGPEQLDDARPGPASPTTSARWPPCRSRTVSRSSGRRETVVVAARPHPVGLASRVARHEPRDEQAWSARRRPSTQAFAGSLASASAASARSCSASSRFAAESSFFTSFSTARRL